MHLHNIKPLSLDSVSSWTWFRREDVPQLLDNLLQLHHSVLLIIKIFTYNKIYIKNVLNNFHHRLTDTHNPKSLPETIFKSYVSESCYRWLAWWQDERASGCKVVPGHTCRFSVCRLPTGRLPLVATPWHRRGQRGWIWAIGLRVIFGLEDTKNN